MPDAVSDTKPDHVGYSEMFRAVAAQQDLDDYNNAVSGADVGRIQRHGARSEIDPLTGEKKGSAAQRAARSLDWLLANDLVYVQAYESASREVSATFELASDILERLLREQTLVTDQITELTDSAATLSDGRKVFKDKDGLVRDADGEVIDDMLAAEIVWNGDEPSYEEFVALQDRADKLDAAINEVRGIGIGLGGLQGELADNETPPDVGRLKEIEQRGQELDKRLEEIEAMNFDLSAQASAELEIRMPAPTSIAAADLPTKLN